MDLYCVSYLSIMAFVSILFISAILFGSHEGFRWFASWGWWLGRGGGCFGLGRWGCYGTSILGADGMMIGTGAQNTNDIEAGCTTSATAADICANYTDGTYSDWFLPSKDELNEMYLNIGQGNALGLGNIGGFANDGYWSSNEVCDPIYAGFQFFGSGYQKYNYKDNRYYVRAVRAF